MALSTVEMIFYIRIHTSLQIHYNCKENQQLSKRLEPPLYTKHNDQAKVLSTLLLSLAQVILMTLLLSLPHRNTQE